MNLLLVRLYHLKLKFFDSNWIIEGGTAKIPCKRCGKKFKSYSRYRGMNFEYDLYCEHCEKKLLGDDLIC